MTFLTNLVFMIYSLVVAVLPVSKYVEGVTGQPASFLPSQAKTQNDKTISSLIYRGLFKYDIYGQTVPDLAETWSVSGDGLSYTIKLKDKQYWTNGKKITSDDLIYTSFKSPDLSGVATDKIDDLTVRFTLPNKYSPFFSLLTLGVMPANAQEEGNPLFPISSGDFRVARTERTGRLIKQVTLVSQDKDFSIKKLIFRYYSNEDELETAAKLGEIDAFLASGEHKLENFKDRRFPLQGIYYALFFNLRDKRYENQILRQKLEKSLPLEDLILNLGIPVEGAISRSTYTDKSINFNPYDENFRDYLETIQIKISTPNIQTHTSLAKEIANVWEDSLGVSVDVEKIDAEKIISDVIEPRKFEVLLYGQEVGRDPDRYVLWHSTQKDFPGLNLSGFEQIRADKALEEGRNELDNDKRLNHYKEFQKVIADNVPAIFLYHPYNHYYVSKYIEGIGDKYTFTQADRFLDFANWKKISTN